MAEKDEKPPVPQGTEAAQRAKAEDKADAQAQAQATLAQNTAAANARSEAGAKSAEANKAATGSPSGTVSAKENQPVATPVDTGAPEMKQPSAKGPAGQTPHDAGVMTTHAVDKLADMPVQPAVLAPSPTQDPPLNVAARVPVGSSRVDNTRRMSGVEGAGDALQGFPGGHLGAGPPGGLAANPNPQPTGPNPPVRSRGGASEEGAKRA